MWNVPKGNIQPLNNYLEPHGEHGNLQLKDITIVQERKQAKKKETYLVSQFINLQVFCYERFLPTSSFSCPFN
jgi:hypothetical protein